MARLRSASLAAWGRCPPRGLPIFKLVAAWSKAHPSPLVADFLKTIRCRDCERGTQAVQANLEFASQSNLYRPLTA